MKKSITPARAEMARHILSARRIAEDGGEHVLAYMLEMALMEIVGDEEASEFIRRMPTIPDNDE